MPERHTIRVWLVDDDEQLLQLLADLLNRHLRVFCPRQFASAESALDALAREVPPDVLLLDVNMRGKSGLDAIRPMLARAPSMRILMLTTFYDDLAESKAMAAGASGFLLKSYEPPELVRAIEAAHDEPKASLFSTLAARQFSTLPARSAANACAPSGPKPFRFLRSLLAMLTL